ncbi:PWI domain-containing protein, partial [Tribonema minus]
DKALMKKMAKADMFSKTLELKVDMKKVNLPVMSKWITGKITQLLGYEDDIVIGTAINFLEASADSARLDPRKLQLQLTGFLEKATRPFMEELWALLADAQACPGGIPAAFLEQKKEEMLAQQA